MIQQIDTNILLWFNSILGVSPALDMFFFFLAEYLIWLMPLGFVAAFAISKTAPRKWLILVLLVALGILLAMGLNQLIGMFFFRPRPFVGHQIFYYASPGLLPKSFPSDHATVAFLMASALLFARFRLWGWVLIAVAVVVGASRVVIGIHYPLDILAGAGIGLLFGLVVAKVFRIFR